jgi:hypothetical protein
MSSSKESNPHSGVGRVNLAYLCSGLKISTKSVLAYLSLRYNEEKKCTWVSVGDIAHSCSMCVATVKAALRELLAQGLIERELRDESVKKSRKTIINWGVVEARAERYRLPHKVTPVTTPAATIAADVAIADTLDKQMEEVDDRSPAFDDTYALSDEIIALLKNDFGAHPTFDLPDWKQVMKVCVRACIDEAGSGDACLDVLTTVCTTKTFAQTRQSVAKSLRLGGYIRQSFPGWKNACAEENNANEYLDSMCEGAAESGEHLTASFTPQHVSFIPSFKKWLKEELGPYMLSIKDYTDETNENPLIEIEVSKPYIAARLLRRFSGHNVNPEVLPDREDLQVAEVAFWAINNEDWGEHLKNSLNGEEFFLGNFTEMRREYVCQRNDENSFDPEWPEPSEEYVSIAE